MTLKQYWWRARSKVLYLVKRPITETISIKSTGCTALKSKQSFVSGSKKLLFFGVYCEGPNSACKILSYSCSYVIGLVNIIDLITQRKSRGYRCVAYLSMFLRKSSLYKWMFDVDMGMNSRLACMKYIILALFMISSPVSISFGLKLRKYLLDRVPLIIWVRPSLIYVLSRLVNSNRSLSRWQM